MRNQLFDLLTFVVVFIYASIIVFFGISFDVQNVAIFLIASFTCPLLAYYALVFIKKSFFDYNRIFYFFTRSVTLQIVDPLLN